MRPSSPGGARAASPTTRMTMLSTPAALMDAGKLRKNAKGGILVTPEEIKSVFSLLDVEKTGQISLQVDGERFLQMTAKEYRFLMNNKRELTEEDLLELLLDNELQNFDPLLDAFKAFDPSEAGHVNPSKLREVFKSCGFGELSDEEFDIMSRAADFDGDGVIGMEDFKALLRPPNA